MYEEARLKASNEALKRYDEFGFSRVGPSLRDIGNTNYKAPQGTEADKVVNPFEDPDIF